MKIVFDIDEKDFRFIKSVKSIMKNSDTFQQISCDLFEAVKNGEVVYPMHIAPVTDNMTHEPIDVKVHISTVIDEEVKKNEKVRNKD